jgi:hypothetical protein
MNTALVRRQLEARRRELFLTARFEPYGSGVPGPVELAEVEAALAELDRA